MSSPPTTATVAVNGTTLRYTRQGHGPPLLLVHGAGEDAGMLTAQAAAFATGGYDAITYDRRGTAESGREDWPGAGAGQHADDAAALLDALDARGATVLGLSSGGIVALALAARQPEAVGRVFAWEPPAVGVIPGGAEMTAQILQPIEAHLTEHPGDYVGAQALLLTLILGFPVEVDDPAFEDARRNAESMIRDDPAITLEPFDPASFTDRAVTVVVGDQPNEVVAGAVLALGAFPDIDVVRIHAGHEVYFEDPAALVDVVGSSH